MLTVKLPFCSFKSLVISILHFACVRLPSQIYVITNSTCVWPLFPSDYFIVVYRTGLFLLSLFSPLQILFNSFFLYDLLSLVWIPGMSRAGSCEGMYNVPPEATSLKKESPSSSQQPLTSHSSTEIAGLMSLHPEVLCR